MGQLQESFTTNRKCISRSVEWRGLPHPQPQVPLQQRAGNKRFFSFAVVSVQNMSSKPGLGRKVRLDLYSWYVVKHVFMLSKIK